jgi:hypothetical protein
MTTMSDEKKQDTAPEVEEPKVDAEPEAEETGEHIESKEIDYEAELAKEKEIRKQAEKALASDRYDSSKNKRTANEEDDSSEEDEPLTKAQVEQMISEGTQVSTKAVTEAKAEIIASTLSGSDAEKNLVLDKWKHRTFPAHLSLEDQVREAHVLANSKRILGKADEIKRAMKGKDGISTDSATTHRVSAKSGAEGKVSSDVKKVLADGNWKYNQAAGRYEKQSGSGKLMYRDAKTGRIRLEGEAPPQAR